MKRSWITSHKDAEGWTTVEEHSEDDAGVEKVRELLKVKIPADVTIEDVMKFADHLKALAVAGKVGAN